MPCRPARPPRGLYLALSALLSLAACSHAPSPPSPGDPSGLALRALERALAGDAVRAVREIRDAMAGSDAATRAALLEAEAWSWILGGEPGKAKEALASSVGEVPRVLQARLEAVTDRARLRSLAAESRADPASSALDSLALELMSGEVDIRDVSIGNMGAVTALATRLAGWSVAPPDAARSPAPVPPVAAGAAARAQPVLVVGEPESVEADDATIAVARLACRDSLHKTGAFTVVDAASRRGAVEELELQLSGAAAGDRDRAIAGLFAADYVVSGSVIRSEGGWLVAWTLSSAADGGIVASEFSAAADHAAIRGSANRFSSSLASLARRGSLPPLR